MEKSAISKQYKAEIEVISGKQLKLREILMSGKHVKPVDIEEAMDWEKGLAYQTRLDTMENIGQRQIFSNERQTEMEDPESEEPTEGEDFIPDEPTEPEDSEE